MTEIEVDSFAGGGGASTGITLAVGRSPAIAINHDPAAIEMHRLNHPESEHFQENLFLLDPHRVTRGRPVGLAWFSPDCTHFSRAKGATPVKKEIRSLAWVVVRWAMTVKPRVIMLENVREFEQWGPLVPQWACRRCTWKGTEGQAKLARARRRCPRCDSLRVAPADPAAEVPDPDRKGITFRRWVGRLRSLGYQVEWRNLNAADYGAPTHRRRLFLVARRDSEPIVWPKPTHAAPAKLGPGQLPYRTAAEIIDWDIPCPSIFERKKPLVENTHRRLAMGLKRYVLEAAEPFLVHINHGTDPFRGQGLDQPIGTITGSRGQAVVSPYISRLCQTGGNGAYVNDTREPLTTIVSKREHLLAAATLVQTGYGERRGQSPRVPGLDKPLGTVVSGGCKHAAVTAFLAKYYGGVVGHGVDRPIGTVTAWDHHAMVAANLVKFRGDSKGRPVGEPLPTVTSGAGAARPAGAAHALGIAAAYLARFNHGDKQWNSVDEPLGTVTSQGNKFGLVFAWLMKYNGTAVGQTLLEPMHTAVGNDRFGLVIVEVQPGVFEPAVGVHVPGIGPCVIADIGLRMLTPRELARGQGFHDAYILTGSQSNQVARIGNSVVPAMAQVLVEANYRPRRVRRRRVARPAAA